MTLAPAGLSGSADPFRKPAAPDPDDDAVDLGAYVRMLWSYRFIVAGVAIASAALLAGWSLSGKRVYEAQSTLLLSQSKLIDRVFTEQLTPATFLPMLVSRSAAASIIKELGLDKPPREISPSRFFGTVVTVEPVRNTTVFVVSATLDDPELAARAANRVAEKAVELSRRISQEEASRSRDNLQQQRDEARSRVEQAVEAVRKFREASQIELLRKDVDAMLGQRGELLTLLVQIESERAKLTSGERELATRQKVGTIRKTLVESDALLAEAARREMPNDLRGLEAHNEFLDPVYENLDNQVAVSRTVLAGLERRKSQLVDVRKLDGAQLSQLTRLYSLEGQQLELDMERDLATAVYKQVATAFETARVQVAARSAHLDILDPAIASDRPVSRNVARNALVGLVAGFVLASIGAVVHGAIRRVS